LPTAGAVGGCVALLTVAGSLSATLTVVRLLLTVAGSLLIALAIVRILLPATLTIRGCVPLAATAPLVVFAAGPTVFLSPALRRVGLILIYQNKFLYKK
jgi:hypothetical protein